MKFEKLKKYISAGNTLLGIGSISKNVIDAGIEIANEHDIPILIIASRRQIDTDKIHYGYVNNWVTEDFVKYIRNKQKKENIFIERDHGGPWQNNIEIQKRYSLKEAMNSAKVSYAIDIDCGFDFLHLDPSIDISNQISSKQIFERLEELYDFCTSYSDKRKKYIEFEVGTEEQMIYLNSKNEFEESLKEIKLLCKKNNFKLPFFVVTQIGTKVMETKNVGILNQKNNKNIKEKIKGLINIANDNGFYIKIHNTDYLDNKILSQFPSLGINAANVAPEFGVCETKNFIKLLEENYLLSLENEFLELAYNSKKMEQMVNGRF